MKNLNDGYLPWYLNLSVALSYVPPYPTSATQGEDTFEKKKVRGCGASLRPGFMYLWHLEAGQPGTFTCSVDTALKALGLQRKGRISWLQQETQK